jgi:hypothetical protein
MPHGRGEIEDFKRGNPRGHQQTTIFWVPSSLEEFLAFTFTFCFPNKNLSLLSVSPQNFANLFHFSCLLILYLAGKKKATMKETWRCL